jgi:hypothetical protein
MGRIQSRPLVSAPPIDRRHLDRARRPFRVLLGAAFVGYSAIGTVVGVQSDLAPVLARNPDGAMIGLALGFANGRNPANEKLLAQPVAQGVIPEEARDIIIFWGNVAAVERIVAGGKVGMVEAIELIFECKRNGRADSVYGKARAAIQARSESTYRQRQDRLVELQLAAAHEE